MLSLYTACRLEELWISREFQDLFKTEGEFSCEVITNMLGRLKWYNEQAFRLMGRVDSWRRLHNIIWFLLRSGKCLLSNKIADHPGSEAVLNGFYRGWNTLLSCCPMLLFCAKVLFYVRILFRDTLPCWHTLRCWDTLLSWEQQGFSSEFCTVYVGVVELLWHSCL